MGLATPYCFYLGLTDQPDLLQVLWDQGIRFIRSYGRKEFGFNPLSLDIQPFFYADQGFPELLECPVQGWQDCIWRDRFGWHANWERQVFQYLDYIADHNLYYGLLQHDWASLKGDRHMIRTRAILDYALKKQIRVLTYRELYERMITKTT
jgi:hypothetical protein